MNLRKIRKSNSFSYKAVNYMLIVTVCFSILVGLTGNVLATSPVYSALLVGIDNYAPGYATQLPSCVNDATGTRDIILLGDVTGRWQSQNINLITDSSASKASIRSAIQQAAASAVAGDLFLYYQSSHGGSYSGTSVFLCTYDQNYSDVELGTDLAQFSNGVSVVVIVDACRSGGLFKGTDWPLAEQVKNSFKAEKTKQYLAKGEIATLGTSADLAFMTACDYNEDCNAGNPYSIYAGLLIGASENPDDADTNTDGKYSFLELHNYAAPRATSQNPGQTAQVDNPTLLATLVAKIYSSQGFFDTAARIITGTTVSIAVTPGTGVSAWGCEELIPAGLTVSGISGPNGSWSATTRKITWYATGTAAATLGYSVNGSAATYTVSGTASFDGGAGVIVTGGNQIVITHSNIADLALLNLVATRSSIGAHDFASCSFGIENNGPAGLHSEVVLVEYYLSSDTVLGVEDNKIGYTTFTVSIDSGVVYPVTLSSYDLGYMSDAWSEHSFANGDYYLFAKVSITGGIPNDPELDNNYTRTSGAFSYISNLPGWDTGYGNLNGGWRWSPWFGYYAPIGSSWIYHNNHGYIYIFPSSTQESIYLYTMDMGWFWTKSTMYPFMYSVTGDVWLWYLKGSDNPRQFFNMGTHIWETH